MPSPLNHPFDQSQLWNKAKRYIERGLQARGAHNDSDWPFWASLSAEFLGKAVLASYHPALVVDPTHSESLLGVCGVTIMDHESYKSVGMATVVARLEKACPLLDTKLAARLKGLAQLRNTELHSGGVPFEGLSENSWAPEFWAAVDAILPKLNKTMEAFVGESFADHAREMAESRQKSVADAVHSAMEAARVRWKVRSADGGGEVAFRAKIDAEVATKATVYPDAVRCPVCQCKGLVFTSGVVLSRHRAANEDGVEVLWRLRTEKFECHGCGLQLSGPEIAKAGLPVDVKARHEEMLVDPSELAQLSRTFEYEPDYGND